MRMEEVSQYMEEAGIPGRDAYDLPTSDKHFPDGGSYRIEISGVEGPAVLEALIQERRKRDVPVHRLISLVQGGTLFDKAELRDFAQMAAEDQMEVIAVPGPRHGWDIGRQYASSEGMRAGMHHRGSDELRKVIADMMRMYDAGIRGFMLVDEGLLWLIRRMQQQGNFPSDVAIKISVWTSHSSAAGGRLLEELGASSFNPPGDLTLPQLAAIRKAVTIPLDFYIYTSISFGGFNRFYDAPEVARICSPCYFKFEPGPALAAGGGESLYQPWVRDEEHIHLVHKKVKWASVVRDLIEENEPQVKISPHGSDDLRIPQP
ncbi:MAG: U32 family peptidase [Anaerolineae bacterium]|nr:U32 family peptidase [Anaerolineae bacterium]